MSQVFEADPACLVNGHSRGAEALLIQRRKTRAKGVSQRRPDMLADAVPAPAETTDAGSIIAEPPAAEPIIAEQALPEPIMAEPITAEPIAPEPIAAEAIAAEPIAAEPIAAEPIAAEPIVAEPRVPESRAETCAAETRAAREAPAGQPPVAAEHWVGEALYLALNPDVIAAVARGELASGKQHWERFGRHENRLDRPKILAESEYARVEHRVPWHAAREADDDLDPESYMYLYADVRVSVGGNADAARRHWIEFGRKEGRIPAGLPPFRDRVVNPGRVLQKPFGINAYGAFAAVSGLGVAARAMLSAIEAAGIPVEVWNLDTSNGPARVAARDRQRRGKYRINLLLLNADHLRHMMDLFEPGQFADAYNIGVWQWELASFRPDWFPFFGAVDEVWTNSQFQLDAIKASAPVPVMNIHLPVRSPSALGDTRDRFGIPADRFVFLLPFDVSSSAHRKNPYAAVTAFAKAFTRDARVLLVLKYHSQHREPGFVSELNRSLRGVPNVMLIAEQLSDSEMAALRHASDCLISPHRSEGYGLNIAEAMAAGKPVIATNYSGNLDFFDESVGYPVDYKLTEIKEWSGPYIPGYIWAEPDVDSLAEQMRLVVADPEEARRRGQRGAERMAHSFSAAAIGAQIGARLREVGLDAAPLPFLNWIGRSKDAALVSPRRENPAGARASLAGLARLPQLSVVVPVYNVPGNLLRACIESVIAQDYAFWDLCLCNDASTRADTIEVLESYRGISPKIKIRTLERNQGIAGASNAAAEMAVGDYLVMLDNDDLLTPDALLEIARAINVNPAADCLYSDETKIDEAGVLIDHSYKPDWSPEHLESLMYVLHPLVVRKRLFLELGGFRSQYSGAQDWDLMLRCSRATERIHHIPKVLYHWRAIPGSAALEVDAKPEALDAGFAALRDHVAIKYGERSHAERGLLPGIFRVRHDVPANQRITLLILTNNTMMTLPDRPAIPMVDNFVASILEKTTHPAFEIVVVDNGSLSDKQRARFASQGVRVEDFAFRAGFNFAAKANFAVKQSRSEMLVLLNDDMEVIDGEWLTALAEMLQEPDVGAVGARLLHADRTVQHVGILLGVNGGAAHPYHCYPGDFIGYNAFTHVIRNYSAVTAACLATRRSVIAQAGGFDERFAVDYNDIDLCLRMRRAGYRIVYQPHAELLHFEGQSARRTKQDPAEVELFHRLWSGVIANDPYYNPNLTRGALDFSLTAERAMAAAE